MTEKALVVTGGGRGIGARIAKRAAASGMPVAFLFHSRHEDAADTLRELQAFGVRASAIQADVANEADVMRAFAQIDDEFGGIGGLVNNAATNGGRARLEELTVAQLESVFRTNVFGSFLCAREAARRMSTRSGGNGGAIVNISSGASRTGSPGVWVHYAASKGAIETMSNGLAKELAVDGIRVNAIRAGVIDTDVHQGHGEDRLKQLLAFVPMKRMGQPDEVAAAAMWLLSSEASYVTGAILDVSGGL
jgi:NAD(P)-dependent dehydrogenase (short-subunit alcohol dehydrogenase family)